MGRDRIHKITCIFFALFFAGGFLLCVFLPKKSYSEFERRKLAAMPSCTWEQVWSGRFMSDFEKYAVDTFPGLDQLRTWKAMTALYAFGRKDNNGIYGFEDSLSAVEYPMNEASFTRALERFQAVCKEYLTEENRVYLSVIPDKNCFLAEESGHLAMDYKGLEAWMEQKAEFAEYIPISDLLEKDDYYRTDTHWRQERITDVANRLAEGMGTSLSNDYEAHSLETDFYGVYYGQAALPWKPDQLQYLTNGAIDGCRVYDWQNQMEIPVYNMEAASGRDPYEMFLSGSLSLLTIENPKGEKGKKLIVFRDSFGSSIAPLLISGYEQITLVDIRYIPREHLGRYIDFTGCDVLFLYSTMVLNHSETLR